MYTKGVKNKKYKGIKVNKQKALNRKRHAANLFFMIPDFFLYSYFDLDVKVF